MSRAMNSQASIAYIAEVVAGTTPATPAFTAVRATGEDLKVDRKFSPTGELDGRRGEKEHVLVASSGSGGFDFELSAGAFDWLFEAAMRNTFATNVLTDANTPTAYTLETRFEAGATDVFKRLAGAECNSLALNFKSADKITGRAEFMARSGDFASAIVTGATYGAAPTNPILAGARMGTMTMGGGLTFDALVSASINLNNNLDPLPALGSFGPVGFGTGALQITGELAFYVDSTEADILTAYSAATATGLTLNAGTTAGQIIRFELPNIVLDDNDMAAKSKNGASIISVKYRALQSSTIAGSVMRITRAL